MICLPAILKFLTLIVCITGGLFGYCICLIPLEFYNKSLNYYFFSYFNGIILFIPFLRTAGRVQYPLSLGKSVLKSFDQGWSEFLGAQNIYFYIKKFSFFIQLLQNNNLKTYLIIFVF